MDNISLGEKPKTSAQNLCSFLILLPTRVELNASKRKALDRDIEEIEYLLSKFNEATTKEQWRELLTDVTHIHATYATRITRK